MSSRLLPPVRVASRLEKVCSTYPGRVAIVSDGEPTTFAALRTALLAVADGVARQNLQPGARVLAAPSNDLPGITAVLGLLAAGAVVVLVDPNVAAFERLAVEHNAGAKFAYNLTTGELRPIAGSRAGPRDLLQDDGEAALILPTSGTTGLPKAVIHTHQSLLASSDALDRVHRRFLLDLSPAQVMLLLRKLVMAPSSVGKMIAGRQVWATHAPIWTITGYTLAQTTLLKGYTFVTQSQFHPRKALLMLEAADVNVYAAAPSVARLIVRAAQSSPVHPRSLFCIGLGGELASPSLVRSLRDTFGCLVTVGYGSTELGGGVMAANQKRSGRVDVGRPLPGSSARVMNPAGIPCLPGVVGQLEVRSDTMMAGYAGEDTSDTVAGGWFRTGDLAVKRRSGRISIIGRADEVIVRHGVNIDANHLRGVLEGHPAVAEACVMGETEPESGATQVWAFVEAKQDAQVSGQELALWCRSQMPARLVPDHFRTVAGLPRTATGKIAAFELRRLVSREKETGTRVEATLSPGDPRSLEGAS